MPKKLTTVSQWKKKVWKAFSLYIKKRDLDFRGYFTCISCGKLKDESQYQAGHWLHGDNPGTWINEKNVHAQCKGCNLFSNGKRDWYAIALERKYGIGILQELEKAYNSGRQTWTITDLKKEYEALKTALSKQV